ncbi:MAG TPA: helix-turn-helix transcriptional regulator [Burkholderiaceae bacterium]
MQGVGCSNHLAPTKEINELGQSSDWPFSFPVAYPARAQRGQEISQECLAPLAEVDRSYLGRVERGNNVTVLTLAKIANVLEIAVGELMTEAEL